MEVESDRTVRLDTQPEPRVFTFDSVTGAESTQEQVFRTVGKGVVENCLAGYNGTIFAYGQTGSGKTYSMMGPVGDDGSIVQAQRGIIPRAFEYDSTPPFPVLLFACHSQSCDALGVSAAHPMLAQPRGFAPQYHPQHRLGASLQRFPSLTSRLPTSHFLHISTRSHALHSQPYCRCPRQYTGTCLVSSSATRM